MRVRGVLAGVLVLVGRLASLGAVPALWAEQELRTEKYVETVGPLIDEPEIQGAIATRVAADVTRQVDIPRLVDTSLDGLLGLGVPAPLLRQVRRVLDPADAAMSALIEKDVRETLAGPVAARVWTSALRDTRAAVVKGSSGEEGAVVIDLAPLVEEVKRRLVADGLTIAAEVRPASTTFVVVQPATLAQARRWYDTLGTLVVVFPVAAGASFVLALVVAPRRGTLMGIAFGTAVAMAAVVVALALARDAYLTQLGTDQRAVRAAVFDAFAGSLREWVWWVFGVALGIGFVVLALSATRPRRG